MLESGRKLRLGTRGSLLARTQSGHVLDEVAELVGTPIEEVIIRTEGDDTSTSLTKAARPGVFVSALRDALLAGEVDFIVHSFKDLPSKPVDGICLAAVPVRQDVRDVLVSNGGLGLMNLPAGAVVGTSSPRRAARVLFARPDLVVSPIRGNVDTRIAKVRSGEYAATILAAAGLNRVGLIGEAAEYLDTALMLPAPAQGALAIECRADDTELLEFLQQLDDSESRLTTTAERAVLVGINASCATAIGASAQVSGGTLTVTAELSHPSQNWHERVEISALINDHKMLSEAYQLGMFAAAKLMSTDLGTAMASEQGLA